MMKEADGSLPDMGHPASVPPEIKRRSVMAAAGTAATAAAAFSGRTLAAGPGIDALRTPDERFAGLPDFPFEPNYVDTLPGFAGLRTHYLDLGPRDARQTFLCLHGEPTWCYPYRKMIPVFLKTGARVIAPDFLGFGRSDKPIKDETYTFAFHRNFLLAFIRHLDLRNITLVVQDWGGMLGLTLPANAEFPQRLSRLLVMNTVIPVGKPLDSSFYEWRERVRTTPDLAVGPYLKSQVPQLGQAEVAAYDAPFPDIRYKAGVRTFPDLVMVEPGMEGVPEAEAAARFWTTQWSGPTFMAIGKLDTNLGLKTMIPMSKAINGCPAPMLLKDAVHFVQEWGEPVAAAALRSFDDL